MFIYNDLSSAVYTVTLRLTESGKVKASNKEEITGFILDQTSEYIKKIDGKTYDFEFLPKEHKDEYYNSAASAYDTKPDYIILLLLEDIISMTVEINQLAKVKYE